MKDIKKAFNPVYRKDYLKGYNIGLNPYADCGDKKYSEAFYSGFDYGRLEYESLNGLISAGIPELIVTRKTLEDFLLAGMLGLDIDSDGYTTFQLDVIEVWYKNGIQQYNPAQADYLRNILEDEGIEI